MPLRRVRTTCPPLDRPLCLLPAPSESPVIYLASLAPAREELSTHAPCMSSSFHKNGSCRSTPSTPTTGIIVEQRDSRLSSHCEYSTRSIDAVQ